jgi:hypothetical protein
MFQLVRRCLRSLLYQPRSLVSLCGRLRRRLRGGVKCWLFSHLRSGLSSSSGAAETLAALLIWPGTGSLPPSASFRSRCFLSVYFLDLDCGCLSAGSRTLLPHWQQLEPRLRIVVDISAAHPKQV